MSKKRHASPPQAPKILGYFGTKEPFDPPGGWGGVCQILSSASFITGFLRSDSPMHLIMRLCRLFCFLRKSIVFRENKSRKILRITLHFEKVVLLMISCLGYFFLTRNCWSDYSITQCSKIFH